MNWKYIQSQLLILFNKTKEIFFQFIAWREKDHMITARMEKRRD